MGKIWNLRAENVWDKVEAEIFGVNLRQKVFGVNLRLKCLGSI